MCYPKKVKVAHTRLPSAGFRSWSRFLAVSLLVMWVINSTVGCHYFSPGLQLPPQPLRGLLPILLLGERWVWTVCLRLLRLRFKPGPFCAWVQHANHSATEPPVLPWRCYMAICLCGWGCGKSVGVRSKRLDGSSWRLAWRLLSIYPTLCCKEFQFAYLQNEVNFLLNFRKFRAARWSS